MHGALKVQNEGFLTGHIWPVLGRPTCPIGSLTLEILRVCVKGASAPPSEYEVPLRARRAELQKESKDDPVNPPAACTDAPVFLISLAKYSL